VAKVYWERCKFRPSLESWGEFSMWDMLALGMTIVFFALALWYVQGCEKLR
jgi:hypothetical protein